MLGLLVVCGRHRPTRRFGPNTCGAGEAFYRDGNYDDTVEQYETALKEAEAFGEQDPRYATSLNNLTWLYETQGRYDEAERLLREHRQ